MKTLNSICAVIFLIFTVLLVLYDHRSLDAKTNYFKTTLVKYEPAGTCRTSPQEIGEFLKDNPYKQDVFDHVHSTAFIPPDLLKINVRSQEQVIPSGFVESIAASYPQETAGRCYSLRKLYERSKLEKENQVSSWRIILTIASLVYLAVALVYIFFKRTSRAANA